MESVRIAIKNKAYMTRNFLFILTVMLLSFLLTIAYWAYSSHIDRGARLTTAKVVSTSGKYRLNRPMGITVDKEGRIFVADSGNNRVVVYKLGSWFKKIIGGPDGKMKTPTSVALYKNRLYVGSYGTGEIQVYDKSGELKDSLPHQKDRLNLPDIRTLALTVDSQGNLYASDAKRQQIAVFDREGNLKLIFGKPGYFPGELSYVNGLAVDEENRRIIALDSNNLRLLYFNFEGKFLDYLQLDKIAKELFVAPRGLAYDPEKKAIYIADTLSDNVVILSEQGKILDKSGKIGLSYPHGLFLGPDKFLYITNRENSDIYLLNS